MPTLLALLALSLAAVSDAKVFAEFLQSTTPVSSASENAPDYDSLGPILIDPFFAPQSASPIAPDIVQSPAPIMPASTSTTTTNKTAMPVVMPKPVKADFKPVEQSPPTKQSVQKAKPSVHKVQKPAQPALQSAQSKPPTPPKVTGGKPVSAISSKSKSASAKPSKPLGSMGSIVKQTTPDKDPSAQTPTPVRMARAQVLIEKNRRKSSDASVATLPDRMNTLDAQIANQLRDDEEAHLKAITFIWQSAVERSDTIRYAIDQLSNREAMQSGKSDSGEFSKKLLRTIGQLGGAAGTILTGSPAGSIGSQMINDLTAPTLQDAKNARLKISDTDMLFLAKAVSSLQETVIEAYETWQNANTRLALAEEARRTIGRYASDAEASLPHGFGVIVDSLLQTQAQQVTQAQADVQQARNTLVLIAGPEALTALDQLALEK